MLTPIRTDLGDYAGDETRSNVDPSAPVIFLGSTPGWIGWRLSPRWWRHADMESERGGEGKGYADERHNGHGGPGGLRGCTRYPVAALYMSARGHCVGPCGHVQMWALAPALVHTTLRSGFRWRLTV